MLTGAQRAQVFEIFGVPANGAGDVYGSVATLFGPAFETYDFASIVTNIGARVTALDASQEARVAALLARWDEITSTSPFVVRSAGQSVGQLADHPAERENIRAALGNLIGVAVPGGGFVAEARRAIQGGCEVSR